MLIIIATIITQGARVADDLRGDLQGSILIRGGIAQAIGVISFGKIASSSTKVYSIDGPQRSFVVRTPVPHQTLIG